MYHLKDMSDSLGLEQTRPKLSGINKQGIQHSTKDNFGKKAFMNKPDGTQVAQATDMYCLPDTSYRHVERHVNIDSDENLADSINIRDFCVDRSRTDRVCHDLTDRDKTDVSYSRTRYRVVDSLIDDPANSRDSPRRGNLSDILDDCERVASGARDCYEKKVRFCVPNSEPVSKNRYN